MRSRYQPPPLLLPWDDECNDSGLPEFPMRPFSLSLRAFLRPKWILTPSPISAITTPATEQMMPMVAPLMPPPPELVLPELPDDEPPVSAGWFAFGCEPAAAVLPEPEEAVDWHR